MDYSSALRNLANGRAIKRPSWRGYIERVLVAEAEAMPLVWDSTAEYNINDKVAYNGAYYQCKAATTAGILPTNTTYWNPYTLAPEKYNIVFHKADKTTYTFKFPESESGSSEDLILNRELFVHQRATDWIEGLATDFAEALDPQVSGEW